MPVMPFVSQEPGPESHQYYLSSGRMLVSNEQRDWTQDEYRTKTVATARGCFGVFDTAKPSMLQFGRTLDEVLTNISIGQFGQIDKPLYRWVTSPQLGPRPLVFIQWYEIRHMPKTDALRRANHGAIRVMSGT